MSTAERVVDRVARLERVVRRQNLALGVLIGAAAAAVLGGAAGRTGGEPQEMFLRPGTVMGIDVEDDVLYRVSANGVVETIAIGERREALVQLQIADGRRRIPGIRWEEIEFPR